MPNLQFDPLGALSADQLKEMKKWGTIGDMGSSVDGHWQKPTDRELRKNKMQLGNNSSSYTFRGGMAEVSDILGQFPGTIVPGTNKAVTVDYKQNNHPVGTINVTVYNLAPVPSGEEPEEVKDYGTDGEGGVDYDNWTMERQSRQKETKYKIIFEPARDWPPFKFGDKILLNPKELWRSYRAIQEGHRPGDIVTVEGQRTLVQHVGSGHFKEVKKDTVYEKFIDRVKVLVKVTSRSWKVSASAVEHNRIYHHDTPPKPVSNYKLKWVTVSIQGNRDDDSSTEENPRSKTYTVTESTYEKSLYKEGWKPPHGYSVEDATIDE